MTETNGATTSVGGLGELSTSTISDACDRLGIRVQVEGVRALDRSFRVAGSAFTLLYQPVGIDGGTVGDFIDDVVPGDVVVIDNAGRTDATVWGDLLTTVGHRRGLGGTVIDGVCRDVDRSLQLGYPLFARGNWMRTGKDRVQLVGIAVPVSLGGVRVLPGDVIVGDGDGVVTVPASRVAEVLEVATGIEEAEDSIREAIAGGMRLDEARRAAGYHSLQKRQAAPGGAGRSG